MVKENHGATKIIQTFWQNGHVNDTYDEFEPDPYEWSFDEYCIDDQHDLHLCLKESISDRLKHDHPYCKWLFYMKIVRHAWVNHGIFLFINFFFLSPDYANIKHTILGHLQQFSHARFSPLFNHHFLCLWGNSWAEKSPWKMLDVLRSQSNTSLHIRFNNSNLARGISGKLS